MKVFLSLPAVCLLLAACSDIDVVTSHYKTYRDAVADQLFERGWLPRVIPQSSFDITTANDLDTNVSHGEFSFSPADAESFTSELIPYDSRKPPFADFAKVLVNRGKEGYIAYQYLEDSTVWVFFVNKDKGHVYYDMWLERTDLLS